jgi:hypothetical protein
MINDYINLVNREITHNFKEDILKGIHCFDTKEYYIILNKTVINLLNKTYDSDLIKNILRNKIKLV